MISKGFMGIFIGFHRNLKDFIGSYRDFIKLLLRFNKIEWSLDGQEQFPSIFNLLISLPHWYSRTARSLLAVKKKNKVPELQNSYFMKL